jgi:hypothetical protein
MDFNIDILNMIDEAEIRVTGYRPARPAPQAVLHDDPKFSDPGDDAEYEDFKIILSICDKEYDVTDALYALAEPLIFAHGKKEAADYVP